MQDTIAILLALAAAGYLGRVAWMRFVNHKGGACGSCHSCDPLVQIDENHTSGESSERLE